MKQAINKTSRWIFFLIVGLYLGTVFLRTILVYQGSPELFPVLGILLFWSVLLASEPLITREWHGYFPFYLVFQTGLVFFLLTKVDSPDFFANLLAILSMQTMLHFKLKLWSVWVGICALVMVALLINIYENERFALVLLYTAGNVFYGFYARAIQRAETARTQNLDLAKELQGANQKLRSYSAQIEQLVVARERNRLARDLHDSVTQTVFSMTLTTQSASLLLERDPSKVEAQLDRLSQLARNALSEIQLLISELKPEENDGQNLASCIKSYLKDGHLPEGLSVELKIEGDHSLEAAEEQSLFHIIQEALNNIVKHAQTDKVSIQLHLTVPMWIEVVDKGRGFDMQQARNNSGRVGLSSMRERAEEIGWNFHLSTSPGNGTCIRVEKLQKETRQE